MTVFALRHPCSCFPLRRLPPIKGVAITDKITIIQDCDQGDEFYKSTFFLEDGAEESFIGTEFTLKGL